MYRGLNYFQNFLAFISAVSAWVSMSVFTSLVSVPVGIVSSAAGIKVCAITAGIKTKRNQLSRKRRESMIM